MSLRFRIGPFTVGRTGMRVSMWRRKRGVVRGGLSAPVTGSSGKGRRRNRAYGRVGVGPFSKFFR